MGLCLGLHTHTNEVSTGLLDFHTHYIDFDKKSVYLVQNYKSHALVCLSSGFVGGKPKLK